MIKNEKMLAYKDYFHIYAFFLSPCLVGGCLISNTINDTNWRY